MIGAEPDWQSYFQTFPNAASFAAFLNELYQVSLFADYAPNGLQVENRSPIERIVTAVTASLETIEKAADLKADALIVHHGLFWQGQSQVLCGAHYRRVQTLIKADMALLAYHLPMDGHPWLGNSSQLAVALGLQDCQTAFPYKGQQPIGVLSRLEAPQSAARFQQRVEEVTGRKAVLFGGGAEPIKRVAIVTGGGQRELDTAIALGDVDLFLTGEMSEQNYHQARENSLWFISAGHHATEVFGPRALANYLDKLQLFSSVDFIDLPNPV